MATHIDLSEKSGHRADHGFKCGAEFNVKIRRRIDIPDFVREQLSQSAIDEVWWEEAGRVRDALRETLSRRYKWIGEMAFVGRGPGWLAIEDTGCGSRNWDTIGKAVDQHLKSFIKSMESPGLWKAMGVEPSTTKPSSHLGRGKVHHATKRTSSKKKTPAELQRDIDEVLSGGQHGKRHFSVGQRVTASIWGKPVTGTVTRVGDSVVFFRTTDGRERWMHPESLTAA
ncbi:MAG: hypothetical protein NT062_32960 [Proteobacteria bacterium]|nr:hypothetical protein [Pseudomonadota bacterium]